MAEGLHFPSTNALSAAAGRAAARDYFEIGPPRLQGGLGRVEAGHRVATTYHVPDQCYRTA